MNHKRYIPYSVIAIVLMLASCVADEMQVPDTPQGGYPLVIAATIAEGGNAFSRASIPDKMEDEWSYGSFTADEKNGFDVMGFYASGGDFMEDDGRGPFINRALTFDGTFFKGPDGSTFSPTHMKDSEIFMYYPYDEHIDDTGFELRRMKEGNDTLRCMDFLSSNEIKLGEINANNEKATLFGTFDHAFAELIIMRGEGFDNPPQGKERITAVLNKPYTHIRVDLNTENGWSCTPKLVNDKNYATTGYGGGKHTGEQPWTDDEKRKWDAWHGRNFGKTVLPDGTETPGAPAWYIIVPTLGSNEGKKKSGERTEVDYIELYDNDGYLQRVTSLQLSGGNTKYVDAGWRYPMEITMKELVPTANPVTISPWGPGGDLTDERKRGINNEAEFARWVNDYNAYRLAPDDEAKKNALFNYGDLHTVEGSDDIKSWHFYVLADLDMSKYQPSPDSSGDGNPTADYIIPELLEGDILDGISTTYVKGKFINHTITNLSKTFINDLKGSVQNFDFVKPYLRFETSTTAMGIVANQMTNASVVNCCVDDATLYHPAGPAGMIAGSMNGGEIKDCMMSGFLIANSTAGGEAAKIVGEVSGDAKFINNNASDVVKKEE